MTTYDDGLSHTINAASFGAVSVQFGSTVVFHWTHPGASMSGAGDASTLTPPESGTPCVQSSGSTLTFSYVGTVSLVGGSDTTGEGAGPGLLSGGDAVSVTQELDCTGGAGLYYGAHGAVIANPASWSVPAAVFQGGASSAGTAGAGLVLYLDGAATLTLPSSVSYVAGSGVTANAALAIELHGSAAVTVPGGTFGGYVALDLSDTASVVFQGSGLSWSGGSLTLGGTGTLSGTIGGHVVSLTVLCTGATLSASGSGASVTFTP